MNPISRAAMNAASSCRIGGITIAAGWVGCEGLSVQIHLHCPHCGCHFCASGHMPAQEVLERMTDDAPWFALAEGATFTEMVFAALDARGRILCPECRGEILISAKPEENIDPTSRASSPSAPSPDAG